MNISSIVDGLAAPLPQPSTFTQPQPLGAVPAPKATRQVLSPEEIRQRRRDRQKQYRDRQRQEEAETKKQFDATATEIKAARVEQDGLLNQQTVLAKAAEYCTAALQSAQAVISRSIDTVRDHVDGLAWLGLQVYSPTDAQLHDFLDKKDINGINAMSERMLKRTLEMHTRWSNEPGSRESIEAQMKRMGALRQRCLNYITLKRPELAVEIFRKRMMPTGPNGEPNAKLVAAVAEMELTPEQLETFEREWTLYLQKTESIRQELRSTLSFLASSNVRDGAALLSSISSSGLLLDRLQAVADLEQHPSSEAQAVASLSSYFHTQITITQRVCLMKHCAPFYPDTIQIGRIIFGDGDRNAIQHGVETLTTESYGTANKRYQIP